VDDSFKLAGVKRFLKRTKTQEELEDLAVSTFSAVEEMVILSIATEGSSTSGMVSFPKWLLLQAIEEILEDGPQGRQIADVIVRSQFQSPL
jgi:hypothetical protein